MISILFIGDIVGRPGRELVKRAVPALVPIVAGAGGVITSWSGGAPDTDMVIAANHALHAQVIETLAWPR